MKSFIRQHYIKFRLETDSLKKFFSYKNFILDIRCFGPGNDLDRFRIRYLTLLLTCLYWINNFFSFNCLAQSNDHMGLPQMQIFDQETYKSGPYTHDFITDTRGVLYATNEKYILEFDGNKWRKVNDYNLPSYCLTKDARGTIYMGAENRFGYLAPGKSNNPRYSRPITYFPLDSFVPRDYSNFGTVWSCHSLDNYVYFQTDKYLFRFDIKSKRIKTIFSKTSFLLSYKVNNQIYIHDRDYGLCVLNKDSLTLIDTKYTFNGRSNDIMEILSIDIETGKGLLIVTRNNGLFLYNGKEFVKFPTGADGIFHAYEINKAAHYGNGNFVFGTRGGGLIFIDKHGKLIYRFVTEKPNLSNIRALYVDNQQGIWVSTDGAIVRIQSPLLLSLHNTKESKDVTESTGLEGTVASVLKYGGYLYVGTSTGIYVLENGTNQFIRIREGNTKKIFKIKNKLFAWDLDQLYEIQDKQLINIIPNNVRSICVSVIDSTKLYVGSGEGVYVYQMLNGSLYEKGKIPGFNSLADLVSEDKDGVLWIRSGEKKLFRLIPNSIKTGTAPGQLSLRDNHQYKVTSLTEKLAQSGARGSVISEFLFFDGVTYFYFGSGQLFEYSAEKDSLRFCSQSWGKGFVGAGTYSDIANTSQISSKEVWITSTPPRENNSSNFMVIRLWKDGDLVKIDTLKIFNLLKQNPTLIYPSDNGVVWLGVPKTLYRINTGLLKTRKRVIEARITRFSVGDSTFYAGVFHDKDNELEKYQTEDDINIKIIPFRKKNRFRIEWGTNSFDESDRTEYQYYLHDQESGWPEKWTTKTAEEYTNLEAYLFPKTYIFYLKARNVYGDLSPVLTYQFKVEPPFYFQIWSVVFYIASGLVLIFFSFKWYNAKIIADRDHLNILVSEKTLDLREKNEELELAKQEEERKNILLNEKNETLQTQKQQLELQTETIKQAKIDAEKRNELLNSQNIRLESQAEEIQNANHKLAQTVEQLETQNIELDLKNKTIIHQQEQLALSQKMASLGEITRIVAHEINSPLSAIKGGVQNFSEMLPKVISGLPAILEKLDNAEQAAYWELIKKFANPTSITSTKEERTFARKIAKDLEEFPFRDFETVASELAKNGFVSGYIDFIPLLIKLDEKADNLEDTFLMASMWKQLSSMNSSCHKAETKIKALQTYVGKGNEGNIEIPVGILENIQVVLNLYDFYLNQGAKIQIDVDPDLKVMARPPELAQVWTALIMSAVYAANMQAEITILAHEIDGFASIEITDNGPVLTSEEVENAFLHGENTRKTNPEISLATTKLTIEHFGGQISLDSGIDDKFTRVTIKLPLIAK